MVLVASSVDLESWLEEALQLGRQVLIKRLSANDTGVTGAHQVGPYVPNRIAFLIAPELDSDEVDPRRSFRLVLASHQEHAEPKLIYYNNRRRGQTRNECRITGFGGRGSAFQDPENTGAILILSFEPAGRQAQGWIARDVGDEELIESQVGPVIPGSLTYLGPDEDGDMTLLDASSRLHKCAPTAASLPRGWLAVFPTAREIVVEAARLIPLGQRSADRVLLERYDCAYAMYRIVEEAHWLPVVAQGFATIAGFLGVAQTLLQRRKARAGRNLEVHLELVLRERGVVFTAQAETEPNVRPDFVFPSIQRYRTASSGAPDLDILASKSTLRDRWPAVAREGAKVPLKHLFTMDDGIAPSQFDQVDKAGIRLVVPADRLKRYPRNVQERLWTLEAFIDRRLALQINSVN